MKVVYSYWFNIFQADQGDGRDIKILVVFYNTNCPPFSGVSHAASHSIRRNWAMTIYNKSNNAGAVNCQDSYMTLLNDAGFPYTSWTKTVTATQVTISVYA